MIFLCDENRGCSTDDFEENWKPGNFTSEANAKSAKADCASQSDVALGWFSPGRAATSVNHIIFGQSGEWVFTCSTSRFVMKDIEKGVS